MGSELDAIIKSKYLKHTDVLPSYCSPETNIENKSRNTLSFKSDSNNQNKPSIESRNSHLISPNLTPEKLMFVSRPATPRDGKVSMTAPRLAAYKAPKINKGCLVETIDYPSTAKLYSPSTKMNACGQGQLLESRVVRSNNQCEMGVAPKYINKVKDESFSSSSPVAKQRRGNGGAYCVECNEWRHKFDFTKSQWRNRPRGFRRCKYCTGEIGSDSKIAPMKNNKAWSPKRFRLKSNQSN